MTAFDTLHPMRDVVALLIVVPVFAIIIVVVAIVRFKWRWPALQALLRRWSGRD